MNKEHIGTALALRYLQCDSIDSLDQRILLQKKMYLAQSCGAKFGYHFNWYIHGPYSKDLTTVAYEVIPLGNEELSGYHLKESIAQILDKVNGFFNEKPEKLTEYSWYELLASMIFLRDEYGISGLKTEEKVIEKIRQSKPWYSNSEITKAWEVGATIINGAKI